LEEPTRLSAEPIETDHPHAWTPPYKPRHNQREEPTKDKIKPKVLRRETANLPLLLFFLGSVASFVALFKLIKRCCCKKRPKGLDSLDDFERSRYINETKCHPLLKPETIRTNFNDITMPTFKADPDHTHGYAAADRSAASKFIDRLANLTGRTAYFVQKSRADERNGRLGSRTFYWTKDLTTKPEPMEFPEAPLVAMVDVDQYIDMPSFLCENVHPTILYTVQPDQVSKVTQNYSYTFDSTNQLNYNVTGGAIYKHHVWNYSTDHLIAVQTQFGITTKVASYLVDRRSTSPDHELIMLTPIGSWTGLSAIYYVKWLAGKRLTRLSVVTENGFTRLMTSSLGGVRISTGRPCNYASATVDAVVDDTIAGIARSSDYVLTLPQVMSYTDGNRIVAVPLLEYHRSKTNHKADVVCPVPVSTRRYQFNPKIYDPKAKPTMVGFMSPLVNGAFAPDRTPGNEEQCMEGRVNSVKPGILPLTPFLAHAMDEFCKCLIPDSERQTLSPTDDDEVLNRQAKPTQRRLFAAMHGMLPKRIINMFMKAEPYANVKDPRAISVTNTVDKRQYSRYMYAFEKILKAQSWYAFSRTPQEIAQRVVEVLMYADTASNTDFNRFDGHGSNLMRDLEKQLLLRAFRVEHHQELLDLHKAQYGLKAYATFDDPNSGRPLSYQTDYTRASGSPETSLFNTLVNAFTAFLALRMTKVDGVHLTPEEAFERLGIYGGDDGLTADVDPKTYTKAATMLGQVLTIEPVKRGEPGIKFLARIYSPDVWFGDANTMCDVKRQVVKFHVTVRMNSNVTPRMKLLEKIRSFSLSDYETPIIGDLCQAVSRIYSQPILENKYTAPIQTWLSRYDLKNQYENKRADWMIAHTEQVLPEFEYKRFLQWCERVQTLDQVLQSPMYMAPIPAKSEIPVVVDDTVLPDGVCLSPGLAEIASRTPVTGPLFPNGSLLPPPEIKKEKKICADPPLTMAEEVEKAKLVVKAVTPKETYEQLKARKIKNGTWKEEKPAAANAEVKESKGKSTTTTKPQKLPFEEMKRIKIAQGTWREYVKPEAKAPVIKPTDKVKKVTWKGYDTESQGALADSNEPVLKGNGVKITKHHGNDRSIKDKSWRRQ